MPKLTGPELYRHIRQEARHVPFMFTSGYAPEELQADIAFDSQVPFVAKPWDHDDLMMQVRELLGRSVHD